MKYSFLFSLQKSFYNIEKQIWIFFLTELFKLLLAQQKGSSKMMVDGGWEVENWPGTKSHFFMPHVISLQGVATVSIYFL